MFVSWFYLFPLEFKALEPEFYRKYMCSKNTVPLFLWKYWEVLPLNSVIPSVVSSKQCTTFKKLKFLSKQSKKAVFFNR